MKPWFYADKVSAGAGEKVVVFASSKTPECRLEISRIALRKELVKTITGIKVDHHPIPDDADTNGCGWPVTTEFVIEDAWQSGYYDLKLIASDGAFSHHFICVRASTENTTAKAVVVLNTNTYHSYNYWGGRNSYAHVEKLSANELTPEEARELALGKLSRMRPFAQNLLVPPEGSPRPINLEVRGVHEPGYPGKLEWLIENLPSPYDFSAGFIDKWEHEFTAWCEEHQYPLDFITDHDFESDQDFISQYEAVILVGHSEYWSANGRDKVEAYTQSGGNLIVFSGNTAYWKVRWEDEGTTLIAHKWNGETNDPKWQEPSERSEATHLWSHPAFDRPEAMMTGLSFMYGGYHRLGLCVARGSAGFTVYDQDHWALQDSDLYYGDVVGLSVPLIGYENDGCPIQFNEEGLPVPFGGVGVPQDLNIIALAPATLFEDPSHILPPMIPPENPEKLATLAYGEANENTLKRLVRGHAVMASFTNGQGEVFNVGTTEWAHGLAAKDPFVEKITHNVLARFGVIGGA